MKEIIKVMDEYNPTNSYLLVIKLVELAQVPIQDKNAVAQSILDELRK